MTKHHKLPESQLEGFREFWAVRPTRKRGGCSLYVSHNITVLKHETFSNEHCGVVMAKLKELNCLRLSLYRPPDAPVLAFEETVQTVRSWLEGEDCEITLKGDFNMPQLGTWEEIEVDLLHQRAKKRETQEAQEGYQTKSAMIWLELVEEYGLHQIIKENTRKENILDLFWTNSAFPRRARVQNNVLLSDHNMIMADFAITKEEEEREEITNPYSTKID